MIDSHCHLADTQFDADRTAVIARAKEAGVTKILCIADTLAEARRCLTIAEEHDDIWATAGVHPHAAKTWSDVDEKFLRQLLQSSPKMKAVGEIGLDYHYNHSPQDAQRSAFKAQLSLAKELGLPAVVHCREAIADVRAIIEDVGTTNLVIHCCTERWEDVKPLVEKGCFLSFTGIATYPQADAVRETIRNCPIDQLMLETDAPYLAPVPHRGKRNEPAFVIEVARHVAELKGLELTEVDRITTANTERFFGI